MLKLKISCYAFLLLILSVSSAAAAKKPNIVFILADDMGYADLGVNGCTDIPTPNIDRLAAEGVQLTNSYANGSFCTPTRIALMSCRYQQRTGNDDLPHVTGPLPLSVKTLADRLREAGYTTGVIGKWHIGEGDGFLPLQRGFDEFYGFHGGGHTYFPESINPKKKSKGYNSPIYRQEHPIKETRYLTDAFGEEAVAFLKRHRESKKPTFLYLAFNAVHSPMHAKKEDLKRFAHIKEKKRRIYAGMLSAMDSAIGLVLAELDESGKSKDTLVIFHNDNGGPTTRNAVNGSKNAPFRGSKCETFEGGIRVPTFLRWPGVIQPNSTYDKSNITFDLSVTALGLANADTSKTDGVNLLPYITGENSTEPHQALFWRSRTRNGNHAALRG
jgi:arylsulfatase A-like enzyme